MAEIKNCMNCMNCINRIDMIKPVSKGRVAFFNPANPVYPVN